MGNNSHESTRRLPNCCRTFGGLRQFKVRGTENVSAVFGLHVIAYNLIRLGNLLKPEMAAA
jgi:hypothetical protein